MPLDAQLEHELTELEARGRLRSCPHVDHGDGPVVSRKNVPLVSFCSNDYLGLARHPKVVDAARAAAIDMGTSARASRLVAGDHPAVRALETTLARAFATEAALVFPTGYQANIGLITALAGPQDLILSDALNHASLIDGCRLSRARVAVYPHADAQAAASIGRELLRAHTFRRVFLLTESVFSMDGDVAPLPALADVSAELDGNLIVDEAHAVGVLGPAGQGACAAAGVDAYARVGTLGKAFGAAGGFVLGTSTLQRYLVNRARTFIFTTGLAPPLAAAAAAAIALSGSSEGDNLRLRLTQNIRQLDLLLKVTRAPTPILPLVLGADADAVAASTALAAQGFFIQAIRPPTVPEGTSRLRLTLSADHTAAHIDALAAVLCQLAARGHEL